MFSQKSVTIKQFANIIQIQNLLLNQLIFSII